MVDHRNLALAVLAVGFTVQWPALCDAQSTVLSSAPPSVEYQYQMYYPRWFGWPGPGWSLGGSLPTQGREGYSSFYGRPLPVPFSSGVYVNSYAYASQLPGGFQFGLSQSGPSPNGIPFVPMQPMPGTAGSGASASGPNNAPPPAPPVEKPAEKNDAAQQTGSTSNAARLLRSNEMVSFGNEYLRHQQWTQASVNYRNAVEIANDNADAHVRLALTYVALKKYSEAAGEFKKTLENDPTLISSGERLATILGPDSKAIRTELTGNVARWTRQDLGDQDRLFLLGAILRFNDDPRSQEILEAAFRMPGSKDHLIALLMPSHRTPGIELTARLREHESAGQPIPFAELVPRTPCQFGRPMVTTLSDSLPPAPPPEPVEQSNPPELHQRPMGLPSGR